VPFRGVQPAAFALRDEFRIVAGRRFERGVREVIIGKKAAQEFAGLTGGSTIDFWDSDWTVVGLFETGGDVHESEIWADAEVTMSACLSTLNFNTFSQVAFDFRVTPRLLVQGLVWALLIGVAGGLLPAIQAARLPVTVALRTL
jgi:putative ABC transport system permease protein